MHTTYGVEKRSDQNRNNERDEMDKRYLNCSFAQKDQVKALGAKWDAQARSWYVPLGMALEPFAPWLGKSSKGLTGEGLEKEKKDQDKNRPSNAGTCTVMDSGKPHLVEPLISIYERMCLDCHCQIPPWQSCEHTQEYESYCESMGLQKNNGVKG